MQTIIYGIVMRIRTRVSSVCANFQTWRIVERLLQFRHSQRPIQREEYKQQQQQQQQKQPVQHELPPARLRTVICGDVFDVPSPQCPPMKDLSKALTLRGKLNAKRRPATPLSIPAGGPPPARPGTPSSPHTMSFRKSGTRRSSSQSSALMMRSSSPDSQHEVDLTLAIGVGAPSGQVSES
mmetsp:Transcript_34427/g.54851  ORF Transcript_34427/g.54851 Transcript_34427/m.54851 type:complete len:181 (+) Transcript_34427:1418-1960(+)